MYFRPRGVLIYLLFTGIFLFIAVLALIQYSEEQRIAGSPGSTNRPTDIPPPAGMIRLSALPGDGQVKLSWEPVKDGKNYTVFRTEIAGGTPRTPIGNTTSAGYKDQGLRNGEIYSYSVRVGSSGGPPRTSETVSTIPAALLPSRTENSPPNLNFQAYPEYAEGGYANKRTVLQGEQITFYIGNALPSFPAKIYRVTGKSFEADDNKGLLVIQGLRGNSPVYGCTPRKGCDWRPSFQLKIPAHWPSGWYRLAFPVKFSSSQRYVDFIVAEKKNSADILFIYDMQTAYAYNVYAGGSFYFQFDATGKRIKKNGGDLQSSWLSFRRPLLRVHHTDSLGFIRPPYPIPHTDEWFRSWLQKEFSVAYISNDALEKAGPAYLERYPLMVVVGTQEYLSNKQIELIRHYVTSGGSLYLSAIEFGYGAVRFEDEGETMLYFWKPEWDPIFKTDPKQAATLRELNSDLGEFFGVVMRNGVGLGIDSKYSDLKVVNAGHWVFEGTGYSNDETLTRVGGLGVGAWVEKREDGRFCITSSRIDCDKVDVLAIAPYLPLNQPPGKKGKTFAVLAMIRQGEGQIFVAPGTHFNGAKNLWDLIESVLRKMISR